MKGFFFSLTLAFAISVNGLGQDNHLSLIYDFVGANFDHAVKAMVGTNDSLYIICETPNRQGIFFRIDENGVGYKVICEFDNVNYAPYSLIGNDTVIYGTTRFSKNGGGTLFEYNLKDYSFRFISDFSYNDVQDVKVKYITDSVLWLCSQYSFVDEGSIFTIKKDGTQLTKIYNDTSIDKGQNPTDFVFHDDSIYIACYNGGGIPYPDGTGSYVSSGSFIRVKSDGTGYEKIVMGGDGIGTQPQSVIVRENKIIGLFAYSGSDYSVGGQVFRCNLNGSAYDSLGALKDRALTKMFSTDSLVYGISLSQIFGINPFDGEIRIFDDLYTNPDWGWDVCASPAFLNGYVFFAAQQGGPNEGGTILRWTNRPPAINTTAKSIFASKEIILDQLFTDPEGDSLSYELDYNSDEISVVQSNGKLTLTLLNEKQANIKITANDGWNGHNAITITLSPNTSILDRNENSNVIRVFPNPTNSLLIVDSEGIDMIEIYALNGKLVKSIMNPNKEIDISNLEKGVFLVKFFINGRLYSKKIIKA